MAQHADSEMVLISSTVIVSDHSSLLINRISVVEDNSLRIVNSTKSDEGSYVCRGENQFGSAEMTTTVRVKGNCFCVVLPRV